MFYMDESLLMTEKSVYLSLLRDDDTHKLLCEMMKTTINDVIARSPRVYSLLTELNMDTNKTFCISGYLLESEDAEWMMPCYEVTLEGVSLEEFCLRYCADPIHSAYLQKFNDNRMNGSIEYEVHRNISTVKGIDNSREMAVFRYIFDEDAEETPLVIGIRRMLSIAAICNE